MLRSCVCVCLCLLVGVVTAVVAGDDVTPAAAPKKVSASPRKAHPLSVLRKALNTSCMVDYIETPLEDAVRFICKQISIPHRWDDAALKAAGIDRRSPVTIALENLPFREVLRLVLEPKGLTYDIRDSMLVITTPDCRRGVLRFNTIDENIKLALLEPIDVDFEDSPLVDCLDFLKQRMQVQMLFDRQAVEKAGSEKQVTLQLRGVPCAQVLDLLLHPRELLYSVRGNVLRIIGPDAEPGMSVRVYNVQPLFDGDNHFGPLQLRMALMTLISPDAWSEAGGPCSLAFVGDNLVVRQADCVQHQIETLLLDLLEKTSPSSPQSLQLRVYSTQEFPMEQLSELIIKVIAPESWGDAEGSGMLTAGKDKLIVRQTPAVHQQIRRFLAQLNQPDPGTEQLPVIMGGMGMTPTMGGMGMGTTPAMMPLNGASQYDKPADSKPKSPAPRKP